MTARHWCFTLNNPFKDDGPLDSGTDGTDLPTSGKGGIGGVHHGRNVRRELVERLLLRLEARYAICQIEKGDSGTEHLQGYLELHAPVRMSKLQKALPKAHFEPRRGTRDQARDYCRKSDTRLDGPFEVGEWLNKGQGNRSDLDGVIETAKRVRSLAGLADEHPKEFIKYGRGIRDLRRVLAPKRRRLELKVYLLCGRSGSGKTRYVWDMWDAHGGVYSLASQSPLWFDGYDSEETLLIDEFAGVEVFGREKLLQVLDIYPHQFPVKGGMVWPQWKRVFVTSNEDLEAAFRGDEALWRRVTVSEWVQ